MPRIVLERSRDRERLPNPLDHPPGYPVEALERAFQRSQDDLATLVPGTQTVIATKSGYFGAGGKASCSAGVGLPSAAAGAAG
jgi:hypothetical protein